MRPSATLVLLAFGVATADQDHGAILRGRGADKLSLSEREQQDNRAVTKVVKMLEEMLKGSKLEGDTERKLFAKHKCYCDDNKATKTARIDELDYNIKTLAAQIQEIQSKTGLLSSEAADLKARMEDNALQRQKLESIRAEEEKAFSARALELDGMISDLKNALDILQEIGADQAFAAQGHTQQMAGMSFAQSMAQMQRALKQASIAAAAFGQQKHADKLSGFLQASTQGKGPFTATYSTQSGEIFGILADMSDTSKKELKEITAKENDAIKTFNKITGVLLEEHGDMDGRLQEVSSDLSGNDEDLEGRKSLKEADETEKTEAEAFLEKLIDLCTEKAKQYEKRVALRASEQTAISQAIAILNSDMAFEAFGKVAATKSTAPIPTLLQLRLRGNKGNLVVDSATRRLRADAMLRKVSKHSQKAAKIASMLEAENPFAEVLKAIKSMLTVIEEEGDLDTEKKTWCDDERKEKNNALSTAKKEILALNTRIAELTKDIGTLKSDIQTAEDDLTANSESQTSQTAERTEENLAYQKNIEGLVEASELLKKAIVVLKGYYEDVIAAGGTAGTGFLQQSGKQDPAPPDTWSEFSSQTAKGNDAVSMLEFILTETKAEETAAHSGEDEAQKSYEEEMQSLKDMEATLQDTLATKQLELTTAEEEKLGKEKDLKTTEELEAKIEAYLLKIKPGCDFIDNNIALRESSRAEEEAALKGAEKLIKGTPAYQTYVASAANETLGECADTCAVDETHVDCLACVNKVSVPGYCAGNPTTPGC